MIPLSMRQKTVTFTDEDGITWTFAVKTGESELRLIQCYEAARGDTGEWIRKQIDLFNEIVRGWTAPAGSIMAAFPADGNPAALFTSLERAEVFGLWHKANSLSVEQKKS
jgi:hypothetical protein